jgi:hypothetical protein
MDNKEQLEKEHSEQMNQEAIERIKQEAEADIPTKEQTAVIFFEDDAKLTLRNGKTYTVPPLMLGKARTLLEKLKTVNVDAIILNFLPTGDGDGQRQEDLYDILLLAFVGYPEVDRDFLDANMDLETARKTIDILIGLNHIKK